jgi:predicted SAM-dependent methyltransferase
MQKHLKVGDTRTDFAAVEQYCRGLGFDIGCGTNRLAPTVLTTDWYSHTDTDMIWNCVAGAGKWEYPFREDRFDFVFASHVLEDFAPDEIQWVFDEWLRIIKKGGYLVILVPDMEGGRYPDWDEKFTDDDEEVKSGKRQSGELKGNPSHRVTMGKTLMTKLISESKYSLLTVQADTLSHHQMTLDFVIQKQ